MRGGRVLNDDLPSMGVSHFLRKKEGKERHARKTGGKGADYINVQQGKRISEDVISNCHEPPEGGT